MIQGNPSKFEEHGVWLFSHPLIRQKLTIDMVIGENYVDLKDFLESYESPIHGQRIEGIVWWKDGVPIGKIKLKDFK